MSGWFVAILVPARGNSGWAGNLCVYMYICRYRLSIETERWAEYGAISRHEVARMRTWYENLVSVRKPCNKGVFCWDSQDEMNFFPVRLDWLCAEKSCRSEFSPLSISCCHMMPLWYVTDHLSAFFSDFPFVYSICLISQLSLQTFCIPVLLLFQEFQFLNLFLKSTFLPSFFPFFLVFMFVFFLPFSLNTIPNRSILFFLFDRDCSWTFHSHSLFSASHQFLYNFQSIFCFHGNFLALPAGQARKAIYFQKHKTSSKSTANSLSLARQLIVIATFSASAKAAVRQSHTEPRM